MLKVCTIHKVQHKVTERQAKTVDNKICGKCKIYFLEVGGSHLLFCITSEAYMSFKIYADVGHKLSYALH